MRCDASLHRFGRWSVLFVTLVVSAHALAQSDPLPSWNDGPAKQAIIAFVQTTTDESSPKFVPAEARIAAFDQDGTTCCVPTVTRRTSSPGPAQGPPDTKVGTFTQALYDEAKKKGWTVISMRNDWKRVFPFEQ